MDNKNWHQPACGQTREKSAKRPGYLNRPINKKAAWCVFFGELALIVLLALIFWL